MKRRPLLVIGLLALLIAQGAALDRGAAADADGPSQADVFVAGRDGYHTFRIPSLLATPRGTLLAFCEGRRHGRGDSGDIDLVLRRSTDGGATWGPLQVVVDAGPDTAGNPCPVVDRDTGTIWLLSTRNLGRDTQREILAGTGKGTRTVWVMKSTDDGVSWSEPVEITAGIKPPDWTWYATGPGVAIQLKSGRLLVPCDHYLAGTRAARSHVIFSDDHGATWQLGGVVGGGVNECQVAERADGSLLLNMRNLPPRPGEGRAIATSRDGGLTWSDPVRDPALVEPGCQASLIRYPGRPGHEDRLLFSNPASTRRERMTVRLSDDGGKTWPVARVLHAGPAAYSCLAALPDGRIGCLYERGEEHPYERITLARFDPAWLTGGGDRPGDDASAKEASRPAAIGQEDRPPRVEVATELRVATDFPGGSARVESIDQDSRTIRLVPAEHPGRGWACWWSSPGRRHPAGRDDRAGRRRHGLRPARPGHRQPGSADLDAHRPGAAPGRPDRLPAASRRRAGLVRLGAALHAGGCRRAGRGGGAGRPPRLGLRAVPQPRGAPGPGPAHRAGRCPRVSAAGRLGAGPAARLGERLQLGRPRPGPVAGLRRPPRGAAPRGRHRRRRADHGRRQRPARRRGQEPGAARPQPRLVRRPPLAGGPRRHRRSSRRWTPPAGWPCSSTCTTRRRATASRSSTCRRRS